MKLLRAEISNFRSIENLTISFNDGCQVLIGINESGKSNILRALQLLDPSSSINENDLRIERQNEKPVTSGYVRFVFELDDNELQRVFEAASKSFLSETLGSPIVRSGDVLLTLREFIWSRKEGIYRIDLPKGQRTYSYWTLPSGKFSLVDGWKKLRSQQELQLSKEGDHSIIAEGETVLQSALFKAIDSILYGPVSVEEVNAAIGKEISKVVEAKLPQCVYWKYSEQYLLPSSVNVNEFAADPDSCLPLKSMFELNGIDPTQVGSVITATRQQPPHRYLNLLDRVAASATAHIHEVWKEHKGVQIELRPHGDQLIPVIQDKEISLDMANRSDGFKRFVSFLLLVSAKVKTEQLTDTLILIDEPEIGLHPRGARDLMNELIRIGESNTVVYSTHSIFMVDKEDIDRHLIVEKKDEITTTWRAIKSRIQDEEVLYGAIGYSIFETLHQKNIIFEGWRDKQVFRIARDALLKESKELKESLDEIGLTFAEGVKDVRHVARFLELANRGCLIISDADNAGVQHQKEYKRENGWGTWLTLQDIFGPGSIVTAEDLLTHDALVRRSNLFRKGLANLSEMTHEKLAGAEPVYKALTKWLQEAVNNDLPLKQLQDDLKNVLFEKLKRDEVRDEAKKLVEFVAKHDFSSEEA